MKKTVLLSTALLLLLIVLSIVSVFTGSSDLSVNDELGKFIIVNLRLPRTIGAIITGASLALSGLIFQSIFRNPMADSYVLGISSASTFSTCLLLAAGINLASSLAVPSVAFAGALIMSLILFSLNRKSPLSLLLTGLAMNFFLSALTTLLIYLSRKHLDSVLFWTMGSLTSLNHQKNIISFSVLLIGFVFIIIKSSTLDILLFDDSTALSSGVDIQKERLLLAAVASLLTSVSVAFCGIIGFVGLMSPHLVKSVTGPKHKKLAVLTALTGSVILLASDLVSRLVIAPTELPVGIVTSIVGAPVFLLIVKRRHSWNKV